MVRLRHRQGGRLLPSFRDTLETLPCLVLVLAAPGSLFALAYFAGGNK